MFALLESIEINRRESIESKQHKGNKHYGAYAKNQPIQIIFHELVLSIIIFTVSYLISFNAVVSKVQPVCDFPDLGMNIDL